MRPGVSSTTSDRVTQTECDTDAKVCSRAQICGICAFFLILTALAIYVIITYPATALQTAAKSSGPVNSGQWGQPQSKLGSRTARKHESLTPLERVYLRVRADNTNKQPLSPRKMLSVIDSCTALRNA